MESIGTLHVRKNKTEYINSYELALSENSIGRPSKEKPSDIEIEGDNTLSRQHFIIHVSLNENGTYKYVLRDNSLNGTQIISGKKKKKLNNNEESLLHNGDVIRAGKNMYFELEIPASDGEEPTGKIPKPIIGKISVPTSKDGKTLYEVVYCEQISYIKADGNYAHLFLEMDENKVIWASKNLKYFEDLLRDEDYFVRIHDSTIVNINKIKSYNTEGREGRAVLENDKQLVVSRNYKDVLEEKLSIK